MDSYHKEFLRIVRDPAIPRTMLGLLKYILGSQDPTEAAALTWLFLKASKDQNLTSIAHHCEKLLLQNMNSENYNEYLSQSLICGSWEMKLVLINVFARNSRYVVLSSKFQCTVGLLREVIESFKEETLRRFGLEVGTEEDKNKFLAELDAYNRRTQEGDHDKK